MTVSLTPLQESAVSGVGVAAGVEQDETEASELGRARAREGEQRGRSGACDQARESPWTGLLLLPAASPPRSSRSELRLPVTAGDSALRSSLSACSLLPKVTAAAVAGQISSTDERGLDGRCDLSNAPKRFSFAPSTAHS